MPTLYIIAGANGSGKTTFAKSFTESLKIPFINADNIAVSISPDIESVKISAGKIFFKTFDTHLESHHSFAIESTLSGSYLKKLINRAKTIGYVVHIIYLYLDNPNLNIRRVSARVKSGGHYVPDADIIRRYYRSKKLFLTTYRQMADYWVVIYNSDERFVDIARGSKQTIEIYDDVLYSQFQEDPKHGTV